MIPELRRATVADLPALAEAGGRAFGFTHSTRDLEDFRPLFDPDRFVLAADPADGSVVGITGSFPFEVTMPGGATLTAPGVTWVSVATTHRRRGILRELMTEQHRAFVEDGAPISLLNASEGGIYGRFGYGQATRPVNVEIDRRFATFRGDAPDPGGVRYIDIAEARKLAPEMHRRWSAVTPGAVTRSDAWWDSLFLDREQKRGGASGLFYLIHADGYASYRRRESDHSARVFDFFAASDDAHAALWRVLLGLDLVDTVFTHACPGDDPLPFLLADSRVVRTTRISDGLWARVLDVPTVLGARRFAVELDVVVEVQDSFLQRGGRFRLRGGPDAATCEPTTDSPDVQLDVATLGSMLFGTHRAGTLARAGLLSADDPAVLRRIDTAFVTDRAAQFGTGF